jgi:hypothetical protein
MEGTGRTGDTRQYDCEMLGEGLYFCTTSFALVKTPVQRGEEPENLDI